MSTVLALSAIPTGTKNLLDVCTPIFKPGRVRCFFAPEDLKIGDKFRAVIDENIHSHEKLMIVLSKQSVKSEWLEKEVETAFQKERQEKRPVLFPIRLDDAVLRTDAAWAADIRRSRHLGDFRAWRKHDSHQAALARLFRDLEATQLVVPRV